MIAELGSWKYHISQGTVEDIKGFNNIAFPLVKRVFANLITNDIAHVQPMALPTGLVHYLDFTFNKIKTFMNSELSFKKAEILAAIKANREAHVKIYSEAIGNYKTSVIAALELNLNSLKSIDKIDTKLLRIDLVEPISYQKEYDKVIRMLEMCSDKVIKLTDSEFQNYILDEWGWKQNFIASNTRYLQHN